MALSSFFCGFYFELIYSFVEQNRTQTVLLNQKDNE